MFRTRLGGRTPPPLVLTGIFLKPPRSVCQKVVNNGQQYESEWSINIFRGHFRDRLRYKVRIYVLFIPAKGTFHCSPDFCITVRSPNTELSPRFFKKASGIMQSPLSVTLSPPKTLDEIQPNLVCGLLT